jgi:hypothetical protein
MYGVDSRGRQLLHAEWILSKLSAQARSSALDQTRCWACPGPDASTVDGRGPGRGRGVGRAPANTSWSKCRLAASSAKPFCFQRQSLEPNTKPIVVLRRRWHPMRAAGREATRQTEGSGGAIRHFIFIFPVLAQPARLKYPSNCAGGPPSGRSGVREPVVSQTHQWRGKG